MLSESDQLGDPRARDRARLDRVTRLIFVATVVLAPAELIVAWYERSLDMLGISLVTTFMAVMVVLVRRRLRSRKEESAAHLTAVSLLASTLLAAPIASFSPGTLSVVPIIALAVVLPWLSGRPLRRVVVLCLTTEVLVSLYWVARPFETLTPMERALGAASVIAGVVIAVVLIVQHGERQAQSISDLRNTHQSLRESEDLYRRMVEAAAEGIWRSDASGHTSFVNARMAELLGRSREELLHQSVFDHFSAESIPRVQALVKDDASGPARREELALRRKDGSQLRVSIGAVTVHDDVGRYTGNLWLVTDVTELVKLQSQLISAERMAAVGNLAAGVAHDFNNLLTLVGGYAQSLSEDLGAEAPGARKLEQITKATRRAAELTGQLLAYGRQQVLQPEVLSLNELTHALDPLLRSLLGERVSLSLELAPDLGDAYVDQRQLERVIVNLAINARDAMPGGGALVIQTERLEVNTSQHIQGVILPTGRYAALSLSDTGRGMDEQTKARLFEPFFTTKPIGEGTGLGLATAYGIVKQSGGDIGVETAPGRGSKFTIYLPHTLAERVEPAPRSVSTGKQAWETILLVDDSTDLRELIADTLVPLGYRVLMASDGQSALQLCERHPEPIHLVLTDVVMRGIGGIELTRGIRELRPDLPILYMSGHPSRSFGPLGSLVNARNFLQKPFTPEALRAKIRENLE